MKDHKYKWIDFHMFEIPYLCQYFSDMAKQGWMLETYRLRRAKFVRCTPSDTTFFININNKTSSIDVDYVSEDDQRFSDFVEEFGLTTVCRYSFYQIFRCDQSPDFPFYDGDIQHYLEEHHKTIMRHERAYYIYPTICYTILACLWTFGYFFNSNLNIIQKFLIPPIFMTYWIPMCIPVIRWLIKKEQYHTNINSILARSSYSITLIFIIIISLIVALLGASSDAVLLTLIIATYTIVFYLLVRLLCINATPLIRYALPAIPALLITGTLIYTLVFPYHNTPIIDVIAPYIAQPVQSEHHNGFYITYIRSSIFYAEYDFNQEREINETCMIENQAKQSEFFDVKAYCNEDELYTLYITKNTLISNSIIDSILNHHDAILKDTQNGYAFYENEHSHLLVKGNKVLQFYEEETVSKERIDDLITKFDM